MQQCADTVKKLSLELGGQRAVHRLRQRRYRDGGQELAHAEAGGAIASKYRNAGQTCVCANRILVQDGVCDAFTKRLAETAGAMKVADGFEPGAVIGPLIDMKAGREGRSAQGGSFFELTVLTDVTTDMVITKEETFGPVAPLYRLKTEEAVKMANDTPTLPSPARGVGLGRALAEGLEYGIVGINEGIVSTEIAPFGGMRESGIGGDGSTASH